MKKEKLQTDSTEIPWTIRDYYKQLYANKMDNLKKMDKFLEKYSLPWLNHEERENMNRSIRNIKIETIIKNLTTNKSPGPCRFTGKFYQTFREEFLKRFQQVTEQG